MIFSRNTHESAIGVKFVRNSLTTPNGPERNRGGTPKEGE